MDAPMRVEKGGGGFCPALQGVISPSGILKERRSLEARGRTRERESKDGGKLGTGKKIYRLAKYKKRTVAAVKVEKATLVSSHKAR